MTEERVHVAVVRYQRCEICCNCYVNKYNDTGCRADCRVWEPAWWAEDIENDSFVFQGVSKVLTLGMDWRECYKCFMKLLLCL